MSLFVQGMKKEQKALVRKWIKALRSGKYTQGYGALRRKDDEFCCLGVLCDIYAPEEWRRASPGNEYTHTYNRENGILPNKVAKEAGLSSTYGVWGSSSLATWNDSGKSFKQIARKIEQELNKATRGKR